MSGAWQLGPKFPVRQYRPWSPAQRAAQDARDRARIGRPPEIRDAVERVLVEADGQFRTAGQIALAVYGVDGKSERLSIQMTLSRIKRTRLHFQIERAMGYAVRRVEVGR